MSLFDTLSNILTQANQSGDKAKTLLNYLTYFGYVGTHDDVSIDDVLKSVKRFQEQFGINEQGIGPKTLKAMEWPRCGIKERSTESASIAKWGISDITYYIQQRDSDLPADVWDACYQTAFDNWSAVCPLRFHRVNSASQANFILSTGSGPADDFDGPSGVLAWNELCPAPNFKGQVHGKVDIGETWIVDPTKRGILLVNVLTHEIGHGLCLTHSNVSSALMAPFYSPAISTPQKNDDIPRIQAVYGPPTTVPVPPSPPTPPVVPPTVPTPPSNPLQTLITLNGVITSISIPGYRITKMG